MAEQSVTIIQGSCMDVLPTLDAGSVNCVVTSPPYWGLRDYGVADQLGLEPTPEQYVENLVAVFREVRRVLRDDGTVWLNLGDSYTGSANTGGDGPRGSGGTPYRISGLPNKSPEGLKPKDLVGIPWRVAFALQADGWWLRSDIIWSKPNPMPESVQDRPTRAHEYVFLLSKSARYWYDAAAIREPEKGDWGPRDRSKGEHFTNGVMPNGQPHGGLTGKPKRTDKQRGHGRRHAGFNDRWDGMTREEQQAMGANKRSVWEIATQPFPGAHFATFPEALVKPCILAGCPEGGTVLDPFAGSGTVGVVARKGGRKAVLIELSADYCEMMRGRMAQAVLL